MYDDYDIEFRFFPQDLTEILEIKDLNTGEINTITSHRKVTEFLEWNLTDVYIYDWTPGQDILGCFN